MSEALGTKTELRAQRNLAGKRLSPWLANTSISEQETARPLLTPGEVMQLPSDEALIFVSGSPPIRAKKLQYFADRNFAARCLPAPRAALPSDGPCRSSDTWGREARGMDERLVKQWGEYVTQTGSQETGLARERTTEVVNLPGRDPDTDLIIDEPRRRRGRRNAPTAQLSLLLAG